MLFAKKIKIISALFICLSLMSCKKKAKQVQDNNVPYTPVNVTIYPNDPLNFKIQTPGGWMYFNGGVSGLVVYRKTSTEFIALDRTSTFDPNTLAARIQVQSDSFTCKDTLSGSKWQIVDGAVMQGPATYPLRAYAANYDGNTLRITN
jgi:hypothetical protein